MMTTVPADFWAPSMRAATLRWDFAQNNHSLVCRAPGVVSRGATQ